VKLPDHALNRFLLVCSDEQHFRREVISRSQVEDHHNAEIQWVNSKLEAGASNTGTENGNGCNDSKSTR
jgi:hypothetical protein